MLSKLILRLRRRVEFLRLAVKFPSQARSLARLMRYPNLINPVDLGGLRGAPILEAFSNSLLVRTGGDRLRLLLAEHYYMMGRRDAAYAMLGRCRSVEARKLEAIFWQHAGQYDASEAMFSALSEKGPAKWDAMRQLAITQYLKGDTATAVETISIAAAQYPRYMPLLTVLSRFVRNTEEIERYVTLKRQLAKNALTPNSAAQLVRAAARAGSKEIGEGVARDALINMAIHGIPASPNERKKHATGLMESHYSAAKGNLVLDHFYEVGNRLEVRFFLMGGTLLGLVRDGALLPWDKDLDFGCFYEESSIEDLWDAFSESPYFIPMGVVEDRLIKLRHITGITVDIFVNFKDGDRRWHGGQFVYWSDRDFKLKESKIGTWTVHLPEAPEHYLENHYGPDWKKPDPHFDVFWEAPDAYDPNTRHRYLNTIAKGIQFIASGSRNVIDVRRNRAAAAGAQDVVDGYDFVTKYFDQYRR